MLGSDFWLVGVVLGLGRLLLSDFGSLLVLLGRRFVGKFLRTVGGIRWLVGVLGGICRRGRPWFGLWLLRECLLFLLWWQSILDKILGQVGIFPGSSRCGLDRCGSLLLPNGIGIFGRWREICGKGRWLLGVVLDSSWHPLNRWGLWLGLWSLGVVHCVVNILDSILWPVRILPGNCGLYLIDGGTEFLLGGYLFFWLFLRTVGKNWWLLRIVRGYRGHYRSLIGSLLSFRHWGVLGRRLNIFGRGQLRDRILAVYSRCRLILIRSWLRVDSIGGLGG